MVRHSVAKQNFPSSPPPARGRQSLAAAQQVTQESSQEGQQEVLSALTESHSDVRRHAVVLILATLDGLQAGPVGGGIRARKADERVGCKRKANLTQGLVGRSHLEVPTSVMWDVLHPATATLSVPVLSTRNMGAFFPQKIGQVKDSSLRDAFQALIS